MSLSMPALTVQHFRVGAGVQADITKNMGAYASLDYTKGDDIENPLQGVVGINVTW